MINQCFHYLPLDGGGREGLGVVVVVVVVVAGPAVFMRNDSIIFIMINMTQSYDKSNSNPAEDYLECLYLPGIAVISNPTLVTELSV